ncbi:MAG: septum formation initiator family protein [Bacillota bacterium]|nr:septum formation initiator family protein [Bacillota bacterium]
MTKKKAIASPKTASRPIRVYVLLLFVFWLFTIMYLGGDNVIQEKGRELELVKQEVRKVKAENDRLRLDIAKLSSPGEIEKVATDVLGMVKADVQKRVFYSPDKNTNP